MSRKSQKPLMSVRLLQIHARLLLSILIGVAVAVAMSGADWRMPTRLLAGWDTGVVCYLLLVYQEISRAAVSDIRRRAAIQDEGAIALLLLSPAAAIASLAAVVDELGNSGQGWANFAIGMGTILLSWLFLHTIFALHYAHEYYGERSDDRIGGLKFPGLQAPDYWDFLYFSLVIAMTSQVSDVAITSKIIRRVAALHGVLSFFFNVSVLALTVNMVSNLIRPG
jgi:uncharacterized membrane protein